MRKVSCLLTSKLSDARRCESSTFDDYNLVTDTTAASAELPSTATVGTGTVRYRALYEFSARSADELNFQPGDIILVFKDHIGEPGWLAGQIRDTVGWFPEAFAECIDGETASSKATSIPAAAATMSPSAEPLPSINEESFEREEESTQSTTQPHARSDGPNESEGSNSLACLCF